MKRAKNEMKIENWAEEFSSFNEYIKLLVYFASIAGANRRPFTSSSKAFYLEQTNKKKNVGAF